MSRPFGASAQAGFGIGMRIIQACLFAQMGMSLLLLRREFRRRLAFAADATASPAPL